MAVQLAQHLALVDQIVDLGLGAGGDGRLKGRQGGRQIGARSQQDLAAHAFQGRPINAFEAGAHGIEVGLSGGGPFERLQQLGLEVVQGDGINIRGQGPLHQRQGLAIAALLAVDRQQVGEGRGQGRTGLQGTFQIGNGLFGLASQHGEVAAIAEGFAVVGPLGQGQVQQPFGLIEAALVQIDTRQVGAHHRQRTEPLEVTLVALLGFCQRTTEMGGEGLIKQTTRIGDRGRCRSSRRRRGRGQGQGPET